MQLKLEKQVATFGQSIAIYSFGIRHKPVYWWKCKTEKYKIPSNIWLSREKEGYYRLRFPAWTVSELGILLPEKIEIEHHAELNVETDSDLTWYKKDDLFCCEYFEDGNELKKHSSENEAILRASVFIELVNKGYIIIGDEDEMDNIKGRLKMA